MDKTEKIQQVKQAMAQAWGCSPEDFAASGNVYLESGESFFNIVSFGKNAVLRGNGEFLRWCRERFGETSPEEILDGENLYLLEAKLRTLGKRLGGEHVRYLHLYPERDAAMPEDFTYVLHVGEAVRELYAYRDDLDNALNFKRDTIALAAYTEEELAAAAGADDYMDPLWQIGIDTLPAFRGRGLGVYLVKQIALEIEKLGKIPFYTTWSPNIASTRLALHAGFAPVWVEYFAENDVSEE